MIICTKFGNQVAAMVANSCIPVSHSPAVIGVAIRLGSNTDRVLTKANSFSVNWINFRRRRIITRLTSPLRAATKKKKALDKLKARQVGYRLVWGAPVLEESFAYAVCKKKKMIKVGDHHLFLGLVLGSMAHLDFDENWKFKQYRPVLYLGSTRKNPFTTTKI